MTFLNITHVRTYNQDIPLIHKTLTRILNRNLWLVLLITSMVLPLALNTISNANTVVVKQLNVPHINQCLQRNTRGFYPNAIGSTPNREICKNMCLTSAAVMVAAYFGKVNYNPNNIDTLKEALVNDVDIPERVRDGNAVIGGAFALTSYTGNDGFNNDNHIDGLVNYAKRKGLTVSPTRWIPQDPTSATSFIYTTVKNAIDKGNLVIVSTRTHARVARGYTNDGQIVVNDSYRNTEIGRAGDPFSFNGNNAIYNLPTSGTSRPNNPVEQFWYMVEFSNPATKPIEESRVGQRIVAFNSTPVNGWSWISIRRDIAGDIIGKATWGLKGTVLEKPKFSNGFLRELVRFDDGQEGWVASPYLRSF